MAAEQLIIGDFNDIGLLKELVDTYQITDAIIGPEAPLEKGMADELQALGVAVIGPTRKLAQIETSKPFARELVRKTRGDILPQFEVISDLDSLKSAIENFAPDYVIKACGLMGGKGVYVSGDHFSTRDEALAIGEKLLSSNEELIIEEKLTGEEFSLISLCDGKTLKHFPLVQDNKRAFVDDEGPNTGGMGSISFENFRLPFINLKDVKDAQQINEQAIAELQKATGDTYKGVIYGGYMLTSDGIKLIEFNARFGDPECINLLHLLETDFIDLMSAIANQALSKQTLHFKAKASVLKYAVPVGYPTDSVKGCCINFNIDNPSLYAGHIKSIAQKYEMLGSRAVACLGVGDTIEQAEKEAQTLIDSLTGDYFYRADIGCAALIKKRINHMRALGYDC